MANKPTLSPSLPYTVDSILAGGSGSVTTVLPVDPAELMDAMGLLADQFGVPRGEWSVLAMHLALKGGFIRVKKAGGKIPHWNPSLYTALWLDVGLWCHAHEGMAVQACLMSGDFLDHWARRSNQREQHATLNARYYEAEERSPIVNALAALLRSHGHEAEFWGDSQRSELADAMHEGATVERENATWLRKLADRLS